jgi:hypothetical protein
MIFVSKTCSHSSNSTLKSECQKLQPLISKHSRLHGPVLNIQRGRYTIAEQQPRQKMDDELGTLLYVGFYWDVQILVLSNLVLLEHKMRCKNSHPFKISIDGSVENEVFLGLFRQPK